ncbi:MAG: HAD-IA family hydrolase [Patescibacteria group bacterium]|jgi:putative hydrolase of the HAD superfamily
MIKAIIFDFGNVIASFDNGLFLNKIAKHTGKSVFELSKLIYEKSKLPSYYEQGKINSDEFYNQVIELCDLIITPKQFREAYTKIFTPIPETIELIHQLKPNYKLGLLSSTSEWDFEYGFKPIIDMNIFDSITLTYQLGSKKPDTKLFDDALKKLKVLPKEVLYIDDLPVVVEAAEHFGMQTILYQNPDKLLGDLRKFEIMINGNYQSHSKQKITVVNENDEEIGFKYRDQINKSDIFRATGLWITNSKGNVLLAKRALTKSINPGKWSAAVAGTVETGETYEQNIIKEAKEEIGIFGLKFMSYEKTRVRNSSNFFIQWFTLAINKNAEEFMLQTEEVAEVRWFKQSELKKLLIEKPEMFTSSLSQWISLFIAK